jgi:cyclophilin family peptidyl-prolyl cis-trans isomerase
MQTMKGLAAGMVVLAAAMLGGCASQPTDITANEPGRPNKAPNDSGGYAKDMAKPPAKVGEVDVVPDIKEGKGTDTHENPEPYSPERQKEEADKAAKESGKAPLEIAKEADHSDDEKYKAHSKPVVAMQTKHGVIYLEMWPDKAPKTVTAIMALVRQHFYDGIFIHRVVPGFVVQAGDPNTRGKGADVPDAGQGGPGFNIPAEFNDTKHDRGILSMARAQDINSAGSQFFICLSHNADVQNLDGKYTAFGQVLGEGMRIVDRMAKGDLIHHMWVVKDLPEGKR